MNFNIYRRPTHFLRELCWWKHPKFGLNVNTKGKEAFGLPKLLEEGRKLRKSEFQGTIFHGKGWMIQTVQPRTQRAEPRVMVMHSW